MLEWNIYQYQDNGQANLLRVQAEVTLFSRIQLIINTIVHKTTHKIQRIINKASEDKLPVSPTQEEKWRDFIRK